MTPPLPKMYNLSLLDTVLPIRIPSSCDKIVNNNDKNWVYKTVAGIPTARLRGYGFVELLPEHFHKFGAHSSRTAWYDYFHIMCLVSWIQRAHDWELIHSSKSKTQIDLHPIITACKDVNSSVEAEVNGYVRYAIGSFTDEPTKEFREILLQCQLVAREGTQVRISLRGMPEDEGMLVLSPQNILWVHQVGLEGSGHFSEDFRKAHYSYKTLQSGCSLGPPVSHSDRSEIVLVDSGSVAAM